MDKNQWLHEELTEKLIGFGFEIHNELGFGFLEHVYHNAMLVALDDARIRYITKPSFLVRFRGRDVGQYEADLIVESKVLLEFKAVKSLLPEHSAQTINYLKASGTDVGLLMNFGSPRLEFKRLYK